MHVVFHHKFNLKYFFDYALQLTLANVASLLLLFYVINSKKREIETSSSLSLSLSLFFIMSVTRYFY